MQVSGRLRRSLALAVAVPVVAVVALGAVMAWDAEQERREDAATRSTITDVVVLSELLGAVRAELDLHASWLTGDQPTFERLDGTLIGAVATELTRIVATEVDDSRERLRALSPATAAAVDADELLLGLESVRDAWARRDEASLRSSIERTRDQLARGLEPTLVELGTSDEELAPLTLVGAGVASLATEGRVVATALVVGHLNPADAETLRLAIDRTDRNLEMAGPLLDDDPALVHRSLVEGLTGDSWAELRRTVLALPDSPTEADPNVLGNSLVLLQRGRSLADEGTELVRIVADELIDDAEDEAAAAATRRNVILAAVVVAVGGSLLLAVRHGRRLGRRLGELQEAATRVARGDLATPALDPSSARSPDELDALAMALDELRSTVVTAEEQIVALSEGRYDDPVLAIELPGAAGRALRGHLRRLGVSTAELAHRADHDPLTGLRDRRSFDARLADLLASERTVGLVCVDLDDFKPINDRYGHRTGDEVLTVVADRLAAVVRDGDVVGRLGGDEFAIALVADTEDVLRSTMDRVRETLGRPVHTSGLTLSVGASVGGALSDPTDDPATLRDRADQAMYRAKRSGKNRTALDRP